MHAGSMALTAGTTFTVGTGPVVFDSANSTTLPSTVLTTYNALRLEDASETGLVGYWKLDEGAGPSTRDWSGTGNTGTVSSSALWTAPSASIEFDNASAMNFKGTSGYVSAGTASLPAANAAQTISAWVNITALPGSASSIVALTGASSAVKLGLSATNLRVLRNGRHRADPDHRALDGDLAPRRLYLGRHEQQPLRRRDGGDGDGYRARRRGGHRRVHRRDQRGGRLLQRQESTTCASTTPR
jgi:hypothetical protein